jgi:hypothetical protein
MFYDYIFTNIHKKAGWSINDLIVKDDHVSFFLKFVIQLCEAITLSF